MRPHEPRPPAYRGAWFVKGQEAGRSKTSAGTRPSHRSERRERRCPLSVLLKVCGFDAGGRIFSELTSTLNISRSGCCVRLAREPLRNTALALRVIPHEGPAPQGGTQMLYEVAWLRPREQGWDVGLFALGRTDLLQGAFARTRRKLLPLFHRLHRRMGGSVRTRQARCSAAGWCTAARYSSSGGTRG